jgi:hypothetical protein
MKLLKRLFKRNPPESRGTNPKGGALELSTIQKSSLLQLKTEVEKERVLLDRLALTDPYNKMTRLEYYGTHPENIPSTAKDLRASASRINNLQKFCSKVEKETNQLRDSIVELRESDKLRKRETEALNYMTKIRSELLKAAEDLTDCAESLTLRPEAKDDKESKEYFKIAHSYLLDAVKIMKQIDLELLFLIDLSESVKRDLAA